MTKLAIIEPNYVAIKEAQSKSYLRQNEEPQFWFTVFSRFYLTATLPRSLAKAFQAFMLAKDPSLTKDDLPLNEIEVPNEWYKVSKFWEWESRAKAYDEEIDNELKIKYEQRYKDLREREYEIWEKSLAVAGEALNGYISKIQKAQDEGKPFTLKVFDIERLLNVGNKLGRQSLEKADVDRGKQDHTGDAPTVNIQQVIIDRWQKLGDQLELADTIKNENLLEGSYEEVDNE